MKHLKFFVFLCILTFSVSCGQQKRYIEYKVKEGENMRFIAKKLDMKTKDLLRLNPGVSKNPKANTVIIVPNTTQNTPKKPLGDLKKKDTLLKKIDTVKNKKQLLDKETQQKLLIATLEEEYKIHLVKKGDTFFSLTRFYNVLKEDLIYLNPELVAGLKEGQIIKIKLLEDDVSDDILFYQDSIVEGISLKTTILLPFRAKELDTLSKEEVFENSRLASIVTDLYFGVEMAIDSLRKQGVSIDVAVIDTERNGTKIQQIIAENSLNDRNVIIGPLYSEELQSLAANVTVPIVFPVFSKDQNNFNANNIITTVPGKQRFRDKLTQFVDANLEDGHIIIVGDGTRESNAHTQQIKRILTLKDSIKETHVLTAADGYIKKEKFTNILKTNEKNSVLLTTDDPVIVASAMNSLIGLEEGVSARVFTFDKNSVLNKIANLKLAKLEFTFVSDTYSEDNSIQVAHFNKKYISKNGVLPSYYATKGFDIAYDVLMRLASGNSLQATFESGISFRVAQKFEYTENSKNTIENKGLFIVKYNEDLTLTRVE